MLISSLHLGDAPIVINYLRRKEIPLVVYGAGYCAQSIALSLSEHGVRPAAFCVDDHLLTNGLTVDGVTVETLTAVCKRIDRFDLAVGFGAAQPDWEMLRNCAGIRKCFGNVGFARGRAMDAEFFQQHSDDLELCYSELSDEISKLSFRDYLRSRLLGHTADLPSQHFPDCYFRNEFFQLEADEVYCDCGAFDGDTLRLFVADAPSYRRIYAWEPDPTNAVVLTAYVNTAQLQNVTILQTCASDHRGIVGFRSLGTSVSGIDTDGADRVECDTLDNLCSEATLIKIDVEGAEMSVLRGSRRLITEHKPKLVVAVYHRRDDIFAVQNYLRTLRRDYRFFMRWHRSCPDDVMLYAV